MNMMYQTSNLILKVEHDTAALAVLNFYISNKEYFEPFEPSRTENFYTLSYQKTALMFEYNEIIQKHSLRFWIYELKNPNKIIGTISFSNILKGSFQSAAIGYKFDRMYWGKGFAYEACKKGLDIMFEDYHLHRIEARIMPSNYPSLKLISKLKFEYEGLEYQSIEINHSWENHYRFAKIHQSYTT